MGGVVELGEIGFIGFCNFTGGGIDSVGGEREEVEAIGMRGEILGIGISGVAEGRLITIRERELASVSRFGGRMLEGRILIKFGLSC